MDRAHLYAPVVFSDTKSVNNWVSPRLEFNKSINVNMMMNISVGPK